MNVRSDHRAIPDFLSGFFLALRTCWPWRAMGCTTTRVLMLGLAFAAANDRPSAQARSGPMTEPVTLAVRLSIDQNGELSGLQLELAIDEVREIWRDVGVSVAPGLDGQPHEEAMISLRILRSAAPNSDGAQRILAWVTAIENERSAPLLFVSLPAVTETVMGAEAFGRPVPKLTHDLQDRLITRAIGRVIAHELGHYLLQSLAHQDHGLMRANYTSSGLVGAWLEPFKVPTAERPLCVKRSPH
jgi:hypothetical protein